MKLRLAALLVAAVCALLLGAAPTGARTQAWPGVWHIDANGNVVIDWTVPSGTSAVILALAGAAPGSGCATKSGTATVQGSETPDKGNNIDYFYFALAALTPGASAETTCKIIGTVTAVGAQTQGGSGPVTFTKTAAPPAACECADVHVWITKVAHESFRLNWELTCRPGSGSACMAKMMVHAPYEDSAFTTRRDAGKAELERLKPGKVVEVGCHGPCSRPTKGWTTLAWSSLVTSPTVHLPVTTLCELPGSKGRHVDFFYVYRHGKIDLTRSHLGSPP